MCLPTLQAELKEAEEDFKVAQEAIANIQQGRTKTDDLWQRWNDSMRLVEQLRQDIRVVRALEAGK